MHVCLLLLITLYWYVCLSVINYRTYRCNMSLTPGLFAESEILVTCQLPEGLAPSLSVLFLGRVVSGFCGAVGILSPKKIAESTHYLTIHQCIIWNANHWNTNHENWRAQFQHSQIKRGQVAPPMSTFAMLPRRIVDQSLATQIGPIALLGLRNARMLNVNFDITPVHFCWGIWDTWWAVMV